MKASSSKNDVGNQSINGKKARKKVGTSADMGGGDNFFFRRCRRRRPRFSAQGRALPSLSLPPEEGVGNRRENTRQTLGEGDNTRSPSLSREPQPKKKTNKPNKKKLFLFGKKGR